MKTTNMKILAIIMLLTFFFPIEGINAIESGKILFKNNCSVCHLGGNNIIIPEKI